MTAHAHITTEMQDQILIITITTDEISGSDICFALRDEMIDAVERTQPTDLVIRFAQVQFIASMGIAGFLTLRRTRQLDKIVLCEASQRISELFELCQVASRDPERGLAFGIRDTLGEALELIGACTN